MEKRLKLLLGVGFVVGAIIGAAVLVAAPKTASTALLTAKAVGEHPDAVTLPFDPPVFTPLHYAYEMRTERDSGVQTAGSMDELTYLPAAGGGYTLRWKTRSFSVDAPVPASTLLSQRLSLAKDQPLLLDISPQGVPRGVLNEAKVRATSNRMLGKAMAEAERQMADMSVGSRDAMRRMLLGAAVTQRSQTPEAFADTLMENPRLLLRNFGTLVPEKTIAAQIEQGSRLGEQPIRFESRAELRDYHPGKSARVVISSKAVPADARRMMDAMVGPILSAIPDDRQRDAARARIADMGEPTIRDDTVITFDLPSGIVRSMTWRKRFFIPGRGASTETRSFVRIS